MRYKNGQILFRRGSSSFIIEGENEETEGMPFQSLVRACCFI